MKVAIVGDSITTRHLAPFDSPEWEIWGQGAGHLHLRRADRYFELHSRALVLRDKDVSAIRNIGATHGARVLYLNRETMSGDGADSELWGETMSTAVEAFPFETLITLAGRPYFTSSVAWMIAFALHQGASEIGIWGVETAEREDYFHQRACLNYWLGRAEERGVKITLPEGCVIMAAPFLYGVEDEANAAQLSVYDRRREMLERARDEQRERRLSSARAIEQFSARRAELEQLGIVVDDDADKRIRARLVVLDAEIAKAEAAYKDAVEGETQMEVRITEADFYRRNHAIPEAPPKPRAVPV